MLLGATIAVWLSMIVAVTSKSGDTAAVAAAVFVLSVGILSSGN